MKRVVIAAGVVIAALSIVSNAEAQRRPEPLQTQRPVECPSDRNWDKCLWIDHERSG